MYTNIHVFIHVNANELFSPFVPFDPCSKTALRASATNYEANDATNDEANMWLVHLSFASLFALPLARMCKCGIVVTKKCFLNFEFQILYVFIKIFSTKNNIFEAKLCSDNLIKFFRIFLGELAMEG